MIKVEICYWRRLPDSDTDGDIVYRSACEPERLWRFDDSRDLDDWQYCPYCGRPLSTATEADDDNGTRKAG